MTSPPPPYPTYSGRRVLLLGATGFIGRWVARRLSAEGANLRVSVRNLNTFNDLQSIYQINGTPVVLDLGAAGPLAEEVHSWQPEIVFNLAGYGVDPEESDPGMAWRVNSEVVTELLDALREASDSTWPGLRLVHAGSALEYGDAGGGLEETTEPLPDTLYGQSKLAGTLAVDREHAIGSVTATSARLFTVYGPGEHPSRLLPTLLNARGTTCEIPLTEGLQQRDFTYVDEVAELLLEVGRRPPAYSVINVATGVLTSVRQFVIEAASVLGLDSGRLGFGTTESTRAEIHHQAVSPSRLNETVGRAAIIGPLEGVRRTLAFYDS